MTTKNAPMKADRIEAATEQFREMLVSFDELFKEHPECNRGFVAWTRIAKILEVAFNRPFDYATYGTFDKELNIGHGKETHS